MIDRAHELPLTRQAALIGISRSAVYYQAVAVSERDLALMRRIDELHLEQPFWGSRGLLRMLLRDASIQPWIEQQPLAQARQHPHAAHGDRSPVSETGDKQERARPTPPSVPLPARWR